MAGTGNQDKLPPAWLEAFQRDATTGKPLFADPLPERRLARLLAAFIGAGLFFLVLPGTLLGVWNLVNISAHRQAEAASRIWIQAHGHAQLFGWVGSFFIGISLYTVPKFRGGRLRSFPLGWVMFALWCGAVAARWVSAVTNSGWEFLWPVSAAGELVTAILLVWQCTASGPSRRRTELWEFLIFAGFSGFILTMALQLALVLPPLPAPLIPTDQDHLLVHLALWIFCFPIAWGFSTRFLPVFLGLAQPWRPSAYAGVGLLAIGALFAVVGRTVASAVLTAGAVSAACWSLRIFHPVGHPPKLSGVDPRYPWFARAAFAWLGVSSLLGISGASPGMLGASRHAFTVGFLATLIFAVGPRILPSFLSSRELWSKPLMLVSLVLLTAGCTLRVSFEPLAYAGLLPAAWRVLPMSAVIELSAVLLFALNIGKTMATPLPAWFAREQVKDTLPLYWYVNSYPATRKLLIGEGLTTLAKVRSVPKSLTLREAAESDGVDPARVVAKLGDFFESRLARTLRKQPG